jgi:DNA-binding Lrp family transcriptional regulator
MSIDRRDEEHILKLFQQNFQLLILLYPEKISSLTELSTGVDQELSNLSKVVAKLAEAGLLRTEMEKGPRGKRKKIQLSNLSINMIKSINDIIQKEIGKVSYVNPQLLDEYFKLLDSSDEEIRKDGAERLYRETMKNLFPDKKYIIKLKEYIFNSKYSDIKELLQTLINLARNSEESGRDMLDQYYRDPLMKEFHEITGKSKKEEERRSLILDALSEILPNIQCFKVLVDSYIALIKVSSDYRTHVRGLLKTKFPGKEDELKITLTRLMQESSPETRKVIMSELDQL